MTDHSSGEERSSGSNPAISTFTVGENTEFALTVRSDACADPDTVLHDALIDRPLPRSAVVQTTQQWIAAL